MNICCFPSCNNITLSSYCDECEQFINNFEYDIFAIGYYFIEQNKCYILVPLENNKYCKYYLNQENYHFLIKCVYINKIIKNLLTIKQIDINNEYYEMADFKFFTFDFVEFFLKKKIKYQCLLFGELFYGKNFYESFIILFNQSINFKIFDLYNEKIFIILNYIKNLEYDFLLNIVINNVLFLKNIKLSKLKFNFMLDYKNIKIDYISENIFKIPILRKNITENFTLLIFIRCSNNLIKFFDFE